MFASYPYFPPDAHEEIDGVFRQRRPRQRLEIEHQRLEHQRMHPLSYELEQQVHAVNGHRLREAMLAEQLRLASGERPGRVRAAIDNVRGSIGGMLIAAGENIRKEPVRRPEVDADPVDAVRHA